MSAGDEQRGERRNGVAMLERGREEMPLHVVHADHRNPARERERLGEAHADEQRADESRRVRHRNGVDRVAAGVGNRAFDDRHDRREMRARRDLGHDAAENPMHVLRENDERLERRRRRPIRTARPPMFRRTTSRCRARASAVCGAATNVTHLHLRRTQANAGAEPVVSSSTRCGSESGKAIVVLVVRTNGMRATRCRGPVTSTRERDRCACASGPVAPFAVAMSIAERTGTFRVHVDSKRSVTLRGSIVAHDGIDALGQGHVAGRRSITSVSGASAVIWRRMAGRLEFSLISSFGEPATIA